MNAVITTAACLGVGSELLGEERLDSNSLAITAALARCGVETVEKRVVGDSVERIAGTLRELLRRVDLVVVTGGLGPTADDVTREAVALALGRPLERSREAEESIRRRYRAFDRPLPEAALKMAQVVPGSRALANTRGSAPGLLVETEGRLLAVLPGVPWEMAEMLERELVPELASRNPGVRRLTRTLLAAGVYESEVEGRVSHMYDRFGRENVTILAKCGVVRLVLSATGEEPVAQARLDEMDAAFRELIGEDLAGVDVSGLEEAVLGLLRSRGLTVAAAESCTGGLLSARLTELPGASEAFLGSVVSYSNLAKERQLGVPEQLLATHGAVSEPVAREMAVGVRERFAADWGVAITGIAGPSGGTPEKPVGTVHWAVASADTVATRYQRFPGDRAVVRLWSVHSALDLLRRRVLEEGGP